MLLPNTITAFAKENKEEILLTMRLAVAVMHRDPPKNPTNAIQRDLLSQRIDELTKIYIEDNKEKIKDFLIENL